LNQSKLHRVVEELPPQKKSGEEETREKRETKDESTRKIRVLGVVGAVGR